MNTLTFILLICFPLTLSSQILTDAIIEKEVTDIILNFRDHNVESFKIVAQSKHNGKKLWKDIFFYSFENDSLLNHKYEKYKAKFIIRDKVFIYQQTAEDKKATENYYNKNITKSRDSANVTYRDYYKIVENDTILVSKNKTTIDSTINKTVTTRYHSTDSTRQINKIERIYLKGDTIQTIRYLDKGEGMFLIDNVKEFSTIEKNENQKVYTTYTSEKGLIWNTSPQEYYSKKNINTKTVLYSKNGLIEKIVIVNKEIGSKYKNKEIITLVPVTL